MGTTLSNGVYLPDEGERNCYAGLKLNWETLDQKVADISALQSAIAGALHREIVASLPTTDIDTATIYMILNGTSATENVYNEFMYVNNAWELIGTSATDLTNYYTKAEVDGKLLLKASASDLTSHTGDTTIHVTANDKNKWNTVALIKQLRLVNAQVGSATTIAFSNIDDTNGIKVGDKCMDLDAKLFEITAVDTTNQTVTVGTALIDLALDANVMHLSGDESASGDKNFQGLLTTIPNTSLWPTVLNTTDDITFLGRSVIHIEYKSSGQLTDLSGGAWSVAELGVGCFFFRVNNGTDIRFKNLATGNVNRIPVVSGTNRFINDVTPNQDNTYNLGSSSLRWRSINDINPGALSFPDLSSGLDISGYITVVNGTNKESLYTPPTNGWICVRLSRTNGALGVLLIQGDLAISGKNVEVQSGVTTADATIPVIGGVQVSINSALADNVVSAKFYPNLGNV